MKNIHALLTIALALILATLCQAQTVASHITVIPSRIPAEIKQFDKTHSMDISFPANIKRVDAFVLVNLTNGHLDPIPLIFVDAVDQKAFMSQTAIQSLWKTFTFTPHGSLLVGQMTSQAANAFSPAQIDQFAAAAHNECKNAASIVIYPSDILKQVKSDINSGASLNKLSAQYPIITELESIQSLELQLTSNSSTLRLATILRTVQGTPLHTFLSQKLPWFFPPEHGRFEVAGSVFYGYMLSDPGAWKVYWTHLRDLIDKSSPPAQIKSFLNIIDATTNANAATGYIAFSLNGTNEFKEFISGHYSQKLVQDLLSKQSSFTSSLSTVPGLGVSVCVTGPSQISGLPVWMTEAQSTVKGIPQPGQYTYTTLKDGNLLIVSSVSKDVSHIQSFIDSFQHDPKKSLASQFSPFPQATMQAKVNLYEAAQMAKNTATPAQAQSMAAVAAIFSPDDNITINASFAKGCAVYAFDVPMALVKKFCNLAAAGASQASPQQPSTSTTNIDYSSKFSPTSNPETVRALIPSINAIHQHYAKALGYDNFAFGAITGNGTCVNLEFIPHGGNVDTWKKLMTVNLYVIGEEGTSASADKMRGICANLGNAYKTDGQLIRMENIVLGNTHEPSALIEYTIGSGMMREHALGVFLRINSQLGGFIQIQSRPELLSQVEENNFLQVMGLSSLIKGGTPAVSQPIATVVQPNPDKGSNYSSSSSNGVRFVVVSQGDAAAYSCDGIIWTTTTMPASLSWDVVYGNGMFVATAQTIGNESTTTAAYSTDGKTWTASNMPVSARWTGLAYGAGTFVAVEYGGENRVAYSTDGKTWALSTAIPSGGPYWQGCAYANGRFVTVCQDGEAAYSTTGSSGWTVVSMENIGAVSVASGNGGFVATGYKGLYGNYSSDGITWNVAMAMPSGSYYSVCYGGGKFIAFPTESAMGCYSTTGGATWTSMSALPVSGNWAGGYSGGIYVAVQSGTTAAYSTDGINWTSTIIPLGNWRYVAGI